MGFVSQTHPSGCRKDTNLLKIFPGQQQTYCRKHFLFRPLLYHPYSFSFLSSFPLFRLARHRQLQLFILRIAAHRHLLAEMSRIVRLVSHPQHQAFARTGRFRVVLHTRAAARGIGVENHQRMPPSFHLTYYFDQYI